MSISIARTTALQRFLPGKTYFFSRIILAEPPVLSEEVLQQIFGVLSGLGIKISGSGLEALGVILDELHKHIDMPLFAKAKVENESLMTESLFSRVSVFLMVSIIDLYNGLNKKEAGAIDKFLKAIGTAQTALGVTPTQTRLIRHADLLDIPFNPVNESVYQFGWGNKGALINSSTTEKTSALAMTLAKDKILTSSLLKRAKIPVAPQKRIRSLGEALEAAKEIGFPVVIKPSDTERGTGVVVFIQTNKEVEEAFNAACKHSKSIIMEKHISGHSYRVNVVEGKVTRVVARRLPYIIGDGVNTIEALIDFENTRVLNSDAPADNKNKINVNDLELTKILLQKDLTLSSVLPAGEKLILAMTSSVSRGSVVEEVPIHPKNEEICIKAAALLRLDIAGVDLISVDILVPLEENGGVVGEVNAKPQIGECASEKTYLSIFRNNVIGDGRIPTAMVLTESTLAGAVPHEDVIAEVFDPSRKKLIFLAPPDFRERGICIDRFDYLVIDDSFTGDAQGALDFLTPAIFKGVICSKPLQVHTDLQMLVLNKKEMLEFLGLI